MQQIVEKVLSEEGNFLKEKALSLLESPAGPTFRLFLENPKAELRLRQLSLPLASPFLEKVVRHSLNLPEKAPIGKREILLSLLTAMATPLRQTVGSCFATAPLILVQSEQPLLLLEDLFELLTRGSLRRVIDGVEIRSPINPHISQTHHPLLKCWEYTVAGFADFHVKFVDWNLYTGLGLHAHEKGGLGEAIYNQVSLWLKELEKELAIFAEEANRAGRDIKAQQAFFRSASSFEQMDRLKREIQVQELHMIAMEDSYERGVKLAEELARLYEFMIAEYQRLLPHYFQELYDPEMMKLKEGLYDDSPAGFRLAYKHGRSDPSVWEMIYDESGYIRCLSDFFTLTEPLILPPSKNKEIEKKLSLLTTLSLNHLQEQAFIESAKKRAADRKMSGLPWAYVSGGNLESLARCYFRRSAPFTKQKFTPENPFELCFALIEFMKDYPQSALFEKNPNKALLIESPTHAFLFKPGLKAFAEAWQDRGNTHTYLRDQVAPHLPPLLFADTNWSDPYLAFQKSPKTDQIELHLISADGSSRPFPEWNSLFQKQP